VCFFLSISLDSGEGLSGMALAYMMLEATPRPSSMSAWSSSWGSTHAGMYRGTARHFVSCVVSYLIRSNLISAQFSIVAVGGVGWGGVGGGGGRFVHSSYASFLLSSSDVASHERRKYCDRGTYWVSDLTPATRSLRMSGTWWTPPPLVGDRIAP
jgi:hypothetical protein